MGCAKTFYEIVDEVLEAFLVAIYGQYKSLKGSRWPSLKSLHGELRRDYLI